MKQLKKETLGQISKIFGKKLTKATNETIFNFNFKSSLILLENNFGQKFLLKEILDNYLNFYGEDLFIKGLSKFINNCSKLENEFIQYCKTINGNYFTKINIDNNKSNYYTLIPFHQTNRYNEENNQIIATAKSHAKMNLVLKNIEPSENKFFKENFQTGPFLRKESLNSLLKQVNEKIITVKNNVKTSQKFIIELTLALKLVKEQLPNIKDELFSNLPKQLVHKDIFPGNILFKEKNKITIIDPDEFMYLPKLRDITYALWCFGTRRADASLIPPNSKIMKLYFDNYQKIDPLSIEELKLIPQMAIRIWVEDLLNFALNVNFTKDWLYGLERKIKHLKNAINGQTVLKLLKYNLIIFDFDGTIGKLSINWKSLKSELAIHFKENHNKIIDFSSYSSGCTLAYKLLGEVAHKESLPITKKHEEAGLSDVTFNKKAIDYIKAFAGKKIIWTSNLKSVVQMALEKENINKEFVSIICRKQTRTLKPSLEGYKIMCKIFEEKNLGKIIPKKTLFIGNSLSDNIAAKRIGCEYLDISQL